MIERKDIYWRAIASGIAVDIGGTLILGAALIFSFGAPLVAKGVSAEHLSALLLENRTLIALGIALGFLMTLSGAWIAARMAVADPLLHGALVGILPAPLCLFSLSHAPSSRWSIVFGIVCSVLGGLLGGAIARRFPKRSSSIRSGTFDSQQRVGITLLPAARLVLKEGLRATFLLRPRWERVVPSAALLAVLFVVTLSMTMVIERLYFAGPARFYWQAIASGWLTTVVIAWICYLLSEPVTADDALLQMPGAPQLFALVATQALIVTTLAGSALALLNRAGLYNAKTVGHIGLWVLWAIPEVWVLLAALTLMARFRRQRSARLILAVTLLVLSTALATYVQPAHFWYPTPVEESDKGDDSLHLTQERIEAQQGVMRTQLAQLAPQRPGIIDLYAITFAPYAEESVFRKESGVVADVMTKRFDAAGHTLQLLNHNETAGKFPWATPLNLERSIQHVATLMDREEDILFLHLTSHGARNGELAASFWPLEVGRVKPADLKKWLDQAGIRHRVISISACYSGSWIAPLADDNTLVMTASDADHTSFGCGSRSDLTFFGRAMYDEQLRDKTRSFEQAHNAARSVIKQREIDAGKDDGYSNPQISVGAAIRARLARLEQQLQQKIP